MKRDATAPTVIYTPSSATYGVSDTVPVTCTAADAMSGLSGPSACPGASGPAFDFAPGLHTLSYTAADNAGNTTTGTGSFTIVIRAADVCALITRWSDNKGVANSLCVKVGHDSKGAFANEAHAQDGNHLQAGKADVLIALVNGL